MSDSEVPPPRTAEEEQARFHWLTTKAFGERIGAAGRPASPSHVRNLIRNGYIRPDRVSVLNPGSKKPVYFINPVAVEEFRRDHSLAAERGEEAA